MRLSHIIADTRRAFTMLELLLVLVVIVAISSIAIPGIFGMLANQQLVRGGNGVRTAMVQTRLEAMRSGRTQMMRFEVGGSRYETAPLYTASDVTEAGDMMGQGQSVAMGGAAAPLPMLNPSQAGGVPATPVDPATRDPLSATMDDGLLPDQVVFTAAQVQATARSATLQPTATPAVAEGWSQPIMFYADGTTSTAIVSLGREETGRVIVRIRGLTGQAEVSEVMP